MKHRHSGEKKGSWGAYAEAVANVEAGKADGVGFCLLQSGVCAFDIDDCRDPITGKIDPVATGLIKRCGATYVEETVSGTGLRIIGLGGTKYVNRKQRVPGSDVSIESYRWCPRYITMSGMTLAGVKPKMPDLGNIDAVITEVVAELDLSNGTAPISDTTNGGPPVDGDDEANVDEDGKISPFLEVSLPDDLIDLVRDGVPVGQRSDQFFHAVQWLKDLDWSLADIVALLNTYPDGIASKYIADNRLATEAGRAFGKSRQQPDSTTQQGKTPDDAGTQQAKAARKLILSSEEFTRDFVPPDYLWDGILLRGFVYSFTARTGDGKTAVALSLTAAIARGKDFAGREVAQGAVLYFAGENSDDVRMRWIAMAEHLNFDADAVDAYFIPGTFEIPKLEARIRREVAAIGGVVLVVVDTSPAYFVGEDENSRVQMRDHAEMTRRLHNLPGVPTVITLCHPVKGAQNDNLVPAGGGAFINSMDGNLCAHKTDMVVTMHHQGKFRGVEFEPMSFELESVVARKLLDSKGRHIPTVLAKDLSRDDQSQRVDTIRREEDDILIAMLALEGTPLSYRDIAKELHWDNKKGEPDRSKVQRLLKGLTKGGTRKLVEADPRDGHTLTKQGVKAAEKARDNRKRAKPI